MTMYQVICACCDKPILDKYVTTVLDKPWHAECVRCSDCGVQLNDKCFSRNGHIFCKEDFYRRYGPRCSGCDQIISPNDLVRKARDRIFHLKCFTCLICRKQLLTGDKLYVMPDNTFICKEDYLAGNQFNNATDPFYEDEEEVEEEYDETEDAHHEGYSQDITKLEANNNTAEDKALIGDNHGDSDDGVGFGDDPDKKSKDGGGKRRGPRTTIKAKQLEVLKTAFAQTPKPTRHIREQLAKETGLPMRVIQVWFQNKRSKERRMKQMNGRGKFFMSSGRKMRGFPFGPPGMDDGRFAFYGGPPEAFYGGPNGGPPFPGEFYPPPPPFGAGPPSSMEQPLPMNLPSLNAASAQSDYIGGSGGPPSDNGFMMHHPPTEEKDSPEDPGSTGQFPRPADQSSQDVW